MPELAEPPVVAPPVEVVTPAPEKPPAGTFTVDLDNLFQKSKKVETPAAEPDAAAKEAEAAKVKEAEVAKPPKSNDKEQNFAELRKQREAAEAARKAAEEERDKLRAEFEALKSKSPELPDDIKTRLTAVEQLEKEAQELRQRVRQTALARDPEFQAKYNSQITSRIGVMGEVAIASGVTPEDWKTAVSNWNEEQFGEWQESMTPAQKVKFNAAWMSSVELYQQQQAELQNAETTYAEMEKTRKADAEKQQQQYFSQNEQLAKQILAETIKPETLKDYEDLGPAAEAILMKAARHEIPAKDIFQQLAANQVLARVTVKQKSRIDELEAQLAERDKKIGEQDQFIAQHAGSVPRGDAAGKTTPTNDKTPIWQNIVVKTS